MMKRAAIIIIILIFVTALIIGSAYFFDRQFIVSSVSGLIHNTPDKAPDKNSVSEDAIFLDAEHQVYTVALYNSGYLYQEHTDQGIDKDIIKELSKRLNIDFQEKVMPRARIHSMLEEGSLPMTVSLVRNSEREKYSYLIPYFTQKNYVLVSRDLGITTEEELLLRTGIKVGIIRSYYYGEHYNYLIKKLRDKQMVVEAEDAEMLYEMMKNEWIEVAFNIPSSYLYYFKEKGISNIDIYDWAENEKPLERCISLSKQFFSMEEYQRFKAAVDEMQSDGTLYEIYAKYLPEDEAKRMCDF